MDKLILIPTGLLALMVYSMFASDQLLFYLGVHLSVGVIPLLVVYYIMKTCLKRKNRSGIESLEE